MDRAVRKYYDPGQHVEGGCFSRTVGAKKAQYFTLADLKPDVPDHIPGSVTLGQIQPGQATHRLPPGLLSGVMKMASTRFFPPMTSLRFSSM